MSDPDLRAESLRETFDTRGWRNVAREELTRRLHASVQGLLSVDPTDVAKIVRLQTEARLYRDVLERPEAWFLPPKGERKP